jgi:hypothetical protein
MNKHISFIPAIILGIAMLSIPSLATAAAINVVDPASLIAKGAGVLVSVEVTCDPSFGSGSHLFGGVLLVQRVPGNNIVHGGGGIFDTAINCDGTPQKFQILATVSGSGASGKSFHKGSAIAQFTVTVFNPDSSLSESEEVTEVIRLVR